MKLHSDYLKPVFNMETREGIINEIVEDLSSKKFDTIAVRGVSGMLLGMAVALRMNKGLVVVRKPKEQESSHSYFTYEGNIPDKSTDRWIILDDFMASGETVCRIIERMVDVKGKFVGFYGYYPDNENAGWWTPSMLHKKMERAYNRDTFYTNRVEIKMRGFE